MHLAGKPAEQCSEGLRQRQGGGGIGKAVGEGRERRRWFTPEGWYPSLCTSQIRLKPCRHVLHFGFSWGHPGRRDGDPRPSCPIRWWWMCAVTFGCWDSLTPAHPMRSPVAPALGQAPRPPSETQPLVPVHSRKGKESKLFGLGMGRGREGAGQN